LRDSVSNRFTFHTVR